MYWKWYGQRDKILPLYDIVNLIYKKDRRHIIGRYDLITAEFIGGKRNYEKNMAA
jgi:hypothetical protein